MLAQVATGGIGAMMILLLAVQLGIIGFVVFMMWRGVRALEAIAGGIRDLSRVKSNDA